MKKVIDVVGAVIVRDGLVLCAQRGEDASQAGLWEFPGGKIEPGESPQEALRREIREELQCEIEVGREVATTAHEYDFGIVNLMTFSCELLSGVPHPIEHAEIRWMRASDLKSLEWAPADIPAVAQICEWVDARNLHVPDLE